MLNMKQWVVRDKVAGFQRWARTYFLC